MASEKIARFGSKVVLHVPEGWFDQFEKIQNSKPTYITRFPEKKILVSKKIKRSNLDLISYMSQYNLWSIQVLGNLGDEFQNFKILTIVSYFH